MRRSVTVPKKSNSNDPTESKQLTKECLFGYNVDEHKGDKQDKSAGKGELQGDQHHGYDLHHEAAAQKPEREQEENKRLEIRTVRQNKMGPDQQQQEESQREKEQQIREKVENASRRMYGGEEAETPQKRQ